VLKDIIEMICFKCGEDNRPGTRMCIICNAKLICPPAGDDDTGIDIKEFGSKGDPFAIKSKKFDFSYNYKTGNFMKLIDVVEGILSGTKQEDDLKACLSVIEKGADSYLYKSLPGIRKKIEAPAAAKYRHILEKAANLTEMGFHKFLETVEEIEFFFQNKRSEHLEKGLNICHKANNLVSYGCVLAEKFEHGEDITEINKEIDEYLEKEHISL
jgi:hypothetical protein